MKIQPRPELSVAPAKPVENRKPVTAAAPRPKPTGGDVDLFVDSSAAPKSTPAPAPVVTRKPEPKREGFFGTVLNAVDSFQEKAVSALDNVTGGRISGARDVRLGLGEAVADGKVSLTEAKDIVTQARERGLSNGELQVLAEHLRANVDRYDAGAQRTIDSELGGALSHLDDPTAMSHHDVEHQTAYGSLFGRGISAEDVRQGDASDCYLLAPLASLADHDPDAIRDLIKANPDGTVTVSFHAADGTVVPITVDRDLPNAGREYARTHDNKLWVALVEKAYAEFRGSSYETIGNGGYADEVIWSLTGKRSEYREFSGMSADQVFQSYEAALRDGKIVTASTGEDVDGRYTKNGFVPTHAYAVVGVHERNGQKFVELRNPMANIEPGKDGRLDGHFVVPLEQFAETFTGGYFQS